MSLVRNPGKVRRYIDFDGLNRSDSMSKDSVYATDLDAVMEFSNKYLIIVEIKEKGNSIMTGQRLTLERIADSWINSGRYENKERKAIVLFATHPKEILEEIPISECTVQGYYGGEGWHYGVNKNLIECLHGIGDKYNIKKLKKK